MHPIDKFCKKLINSFLYSILLAAIVTHSPAYSQTRQGEMRGRVIQTDGKAIPLADIILAGTRFHTISGEDGQFFFYDLPTGNYEIKTSYTGFTFENQSVTIKNGASLQVRITGMNNNVELPAVAVNAEKKEALMQKIPSSLSVLDTKAIQEKKINGLPDLSNLAPNLMAMTAGSPTLSLISMRGITAFSTDPMIGVYIDGVPMVNAYSSGIQFLDIDHVELLRGPQSTLYGRTGLGGIINLYTRQPTNETHGFAQVGLGNYQSQQYTFGLSAPLVKDKLFASISGLYDSRNGYFHNDFSNSAYDKPKTYSVSLGLKYLASERLSFALNIRAEYNNVIGAFPYAINKDAAFAAPYTLNYNGVNHEKRKLYLGSFRTTYHAAGFDLSSVTTYTYMNDTYHDYDYDYSPIQGINFEQPRSPQKTATQEFKIVTDQSKAFKFTGGLYGFIDHFDPLTITQYGTDATLLDPNYIPGMESDIDSKKNIYGFAAFADLTYTLFEKLDLTAGIRAEYDKRNLYMVNTVLVPGNPDMVSPPTRLKGDDHAYSPRFNVAYHLNGDVMAYASYTRGFRSGGFNEYVTNSDYFSYKPEYTDNYEVGVKSEWLQHRLRANLTFFRINWKDQQQTVHIPPDYSNEAVQNVGSLHNSGIELSVTALPVKGLQIDYNLGTISSGYDDLILPDYGQAGVDHNYQGNKQVYSPSISTSLSFTYRGDFKAGWSYYVSPEWKYVGKQYMNYYNTSIQDPFSLLNASAGISYGRVDLGVWAKNITGAKYMAFTYATMPDPVVLLGTPRTYGATAKVSF